MTVYRATIPGQPFPKERPRVVTPADDEVVRAYQLTESVWKAGDALGIPGQSVATRLKKLGIKAEGSGRRWTEADADALRTEYTIHRDAGRLDLLAHKMGRTKNFICRQARAIGLTNQRGPKVYASVWKYMLEPVAAGIFQSFKDSRLGMRQFCEKHGYDDLGFSKTMRKYFPDEWEHVIESKVPRQTMYRVGRAFEYRTRDLLKDLGYVVLRSPGSRSPIDLVAIRPGIVLFVQCKRGGALPVDEWNDLYRLAMSSGSVPLLARVPASAQGVEFYRLLSEKDGSRRVQPMEPYIPVRTSEAA